MAKPILNYGISTIFNKWYNDTQATIPQHHSWTADDYFVGVCEGIYAPVLSHGQVTTCIDLVGRRMVIMGTLLGNLIVYDKHPRGNAISMNGDTRVLKSHAGILFRGAQTDQQLKIIIGSNVFPSIADRIKYIKDTK